MKRVGIILSLVVLMTLLSSTMCFASGLQLEKSSPEDGSSESRPENFLVKLYFNEDISAKSVQEDNENAFIFTDPDGTVLPTKALYDEKKPDEIWVLVDETLQPDTEYQLFISGDLKNANGDTLGEDKTIDLKTRSTKTDNNINMIMMGVMVIGMMVMTTLSTRHAHKKQEEEERAEDRVKVNPYKMAKETGKSVEDIVAKTEKEKAKAKAKAGKHAKVQDAEKAEDNTIDVPDNGNKRVSKAKTIASAGSSYVTGRKAKAEEEQAKAAERAAAGTTRPKNATGKSKNKKAGK